MDESLFPKPLITVSSDPGKTDIRVDVPSTPVYAQAATVERSVTGSDAWETLVEDQTLENYVPFIFSDTTGIGNTFYTYRVTILYGTHEQNRVPNSDLTGSIRFMDSRPRNFTPQLFVVTNTVGSPIVLKAKVLEDSVISVTRLNQTTKEVVQVFGPDSKSDTSFQFSDDAPGGFTYTYSALVLESDTKNESLPLKRDVTVTAVYQLNIPIIEVRTTDFGQPEIYLQTADVSQTKEYDSFFRHFVVDRQGDNGEFQTFVIEGRLDQFDPNPIEVGVTYTYSITNVSENPAYLTSPTATATFRRAPSEGQAATYLIRDVSFNVTTGVVEGYPAFSEVTNPRDMLRTIAQNISPTRGGFITGLNDTRLVIMHLDKLGLLSLSMLLPGLQRKERPTGAGVLIDQTGNNNLYALYFTEDDYDSVLRVIAYNQNPPVYVPF
jgi:hypothetical protein